MTFQEWWGDGGPYEICKSIARMAYDSRDAEIEHLKDEIDSLCLHLTNRNAEVAELKAMVNKDSEKTGWRPIETAPRDGTRIIVGGKSPDGCAAYDCVGQAFWREEVKYADWVKRCDEPAVPEKKEHVK